MAGIPCQPGADDVMCRLYLLYGVYDISALPIIRIRAVLAQVVLIQEFLLHSACCGGDGQCMEVHECDFLQHHGTVDCLVRVLSPGERSVALDENRRNSHRVNAVEGFNYDLSGEKTARQ